jgi:beta-phosphoglucomutase-like phosphatase (HAD superfamily)
MAPVATLSPRDYDAFLFDLDGVLTKTASVHASAWKKLFDGFLQERAARTGETFVPLISDYRRYVDDKPRYDGVAPPQFVWALRTRFTISPAVPRTFSRLAVKQK